jgi:hypothetical protein
VQAFVVSTFVPPAASTLNSLGGLQRGKQLEFIEWNEEKVMDWVAILISGVIALFCLWAGYMLFDRPKIMTPYSKGWKIEHKRINTFKNREFSSSSSSYVTPELATRDYYSFYGITIQNQRWVFRGVEAKISRATIMVWNSNHEAVTDRYLLRLWEDRTHPEVFPLFPKTKTDAGEAKTIGEGGTLDLVIAYNQENEANYYRFSVSSSAHDAFPAPRDLFKNPMPHYAIIGIEGHRINQSIYLLLDEIGLNELEIRILPKKGFPSEINAAYRLTSLSKDEGESD